MSRKRGAFIVAAFAAGFASCAGEPRIERASVERVLATLAADSMGGRRAFSPAADQAAAFIKAEFAAIGLARFDQLPDYLQPFTVYAFSPARASVVLNGRRVPSANLLVALASDTVSWDTNDSIRVAVVAAADDPMAMLPGILRDQRDAMVLIHPRHGQVFEALRGSLGVRRSLERTGGTSRVFILSSEPRVVGYRVEATANVTQLAGANVVGVIPGRREREVVLFSAHYDHIGIVAPQDGDSVANGANDDASGTTAVIELARYFKAKRRPERTLVFAAFTAEEAGGHGARYFARQVESSHIVAMFNIEMIGKPAAQGYHAAWITGFDRSTFGPILQSAVAGTAFSFHPDPYPAENLFLRSDNATLARLGVPAHSISTTPIDVDPDYHQVTDELATLDLDHVTATIRGIAAGAWPIVAGAATPTRIEWTPRL